MGKKEINEIKYKSNQSNGVARVSIKERRRQGGTSAALRDNKSMLLLFAVIVAAIAVILVSVLVLKIPAVAVCVIVLLEIGMALCLHDVPVWLHGLVVIAQITAGVLCENTVFMVLCAVIYLFGILTLRFIRD